MTGTALMSPKDQFMLGWVAAAHLQGRGDRKYPDVFSWSARGWFGGGLSSMNDADEACRNPDEVWKRVSAADEIVLKADKGQHQHYVNNVLLWKVAFNEWPPQPH
ncbi:MAG: hypothetical protein KBD50_01720 [Candidatus Pacebacteria bacterium]|nr:hypothetical protein [Candidatus Paceibacterota bacterium]